jgi:mRNA interferase HigB
MNIIAKWKIEDYCLKYPNAREALLAWYHFVKRASYAKPEDVQADWGADSTLPDKRAVFNIKGNQYRLVVRFNYASQFVYIRWFGTHAEYDRIDVLKI